MSTTGRELEMPIPADLPSPGDVAGKRVVLSGAGRGLGRVLAVAFARQGARLGLVGRNGDDLDRVADQLPGDHLVVSGDVRDPELHALVIERMGETYGGLDVLIANAGISPSVRPVDQSDPTVWNDVIATNLTGTYLGARAAAPSMAPGGRIIVTSSVIGQRPMAGLAAYSASKAGVDALVRTLAVELGPREITVNAVALGWFDSPLAVGFRAREDLDQQIVAHTALRRWGSAEDLAGIFLFLASDAARFITGATVPVDGGYLLR